jgi:competence protein ComEA
MGSFTKREQIVILLLVIGIIIIVGYNILNKEADIDIITEDSNVNNTINTQLNINDNKINQNNEAKETENDIIMVDISGEVNNPGVVVLNKDSRVIDAVEKAGGLTKEADRDRINLSKKLTDEEKIYIPKIGESKEISTFSINNEKIEDNNGLMNINIATKKELESLPGIGSVLAERIIEYRNNNKFQNINEILNVNGIGSKKFESLKELITVN